MRCLVFFILFSFNFFVMLAQDSNIITTGIISASFEQAYKNKSEKRKLLSFRKKTARYNPLNYITAGLLFTYQNIFSEQIQASCIYETSCSEFTKLSVSERGLCTGILRGLNQWSECFTGALYEHPPAFRNKDNKIINRP